MTLRTRKLEDLNDLEKLGLITLSHSRLETVLDGGFSCKAKYFYQYILGIPTKSGPPALLGNVVHEVLENLLEPGEPVSLEQEEQYLQEYQKLLESWDTDNIITEDLKNVGRICIQEFLDRHQGDSWPIHEKEMAFQIVLGNALLRGFIDRVDVYDDVVEVVDYKTGKHEAAYKGIEGNQQLGIYALAAKTRWPDKDVRATLYYLRSGKQKGHLYSTDDLLAVEDTLLERIKYLTDMTNFPPTSNGRICTYCDYAYQEVCPMGASRVKMRSR